MRRQGWKRVGTRTNLRGHERTAPSSIWWFRGKVASLMVVRKEICRRWRKFWQEPVPQPPSCLPLELSPSSRTACSVRIELGTSLPETQECVDNYSVDRFLSRSHISNEQVELVSMHAQQKGLTCKHMQTVNMSDQWTHAISKQVWLYTPINGFNQWTHATREYT